MRLVEIDGKYINPDQVLYLIHNPLGTRIVFNANHTLTVEVRMSQVAAMLVADR